MSLARPGTEPRKNAPTYWQTEIFLHRDGNEFVYFSTGNPASSRGND